ncbi:MAG: LamG domain-containing protein, partial [Planctomycetota bacterium]
MCKKLLLLSTLVLVLGLVPTGVAIAKPPPGPATNPSPADQATGVSVTADLSWDAGPRTDSHDVYFGTSSPGSFQGNQTATTFEPGTMDNDETYYWRIDEGVSLTADLSWTAGSGATSRDVYFGTSSPGASQGNQTATTFDPGTMDPNTTHYWRIDEVNASGTTTGTVWSFTTGSGVGGTKDLANADIAVSGTVSGSYTDTQSSDNTYESIQEIESGGKPANRHSYLEHKWTINVTGGDTVTFHVEAHHTSNSENDDFIFAYSTNDSDYTNMVTVTKTSDDNATQSYQLPSDTSGTVYIRVKDTDQSQGNKTLDTIYIDYMYILSEGEGEQPDANLIGWWKLDDGEGGTAADSGTGGNNGTVSGALWATGKLDGALDFDGEDDYVSIPTETDFDITTNITVAVWVKLNSQSTENFMSFITKGHESAWALQRAERTGGVSFYLNGLTSWDGLRGTANVFDDQWHHVAGVYDGSRISVYVDGKEDTFLETTGSIGTNDWDVYIGANDEDVTGASGYRYCDGLLDDARVYDRALSEEEIKELAGIDPALAWDPMPTDGAKTVDPNADLEWAAGS